MADLVNPKKICFDIFFFFALALLVWIENCNHALSGFELGIFLHVTLGFENTFSNQTPFFVCAPFKKEAGGKMLLIFNSNTLKT